MMLNKRIGGLIKWIKFMMMCYGKSWHIYFKTVEEDQKEIKRQQEQISKEKEDQISKKEGGRAIFRAEQARKVEEIAFRQEVENHEDALAAEIEKPNPAASMLETKRTELKRQLEEFKRINGEYVLLLDADTAGDDTAGHESSKNR
jgi:hypothetical protein